MSTTKGLSVAGLIDKVLSKFRGKKAEAINNIDLISDCRNPWQHDLERLSRCQYEQPKPAVDLSPKDDELKAFVKDLSEASIESEQQKRENQAKGEQTDEKVRPRRAGDRTTNEMKSWWDESLNSDSKNVLPSELPGKPRLLKRWFE